MGLLSLDSYLVFVADQTDGRRITHVEYPPLLFFEGR